METIIIQVKNEKVLPLLKELEEQDLIKTISNSSTKGKTLAEKYAGALSNATAADLQDYIKRLRNSESNFIS